MKLGKFGRLSLAAVAAVALGLGMSACGGGTIGYMWVLGDTLNSAGQGQIAGFKIDDYTGNLTATVGSPYTSGGSFPISLAVRPGGRYVYVVNKGPAAGSTCPAGNTSCANLSVFTVGGDGILTYQTSYTTQGGTPVWVSTDSTGNFVYVLDSLDPTNTPGNPAATGNGDITVFAINQSTGRLSLVTNQQIKNPDGTQLTYFPVGPNPSTLRVASGGCLLTLDQGDQTIFPYSANTSTGQLTLTANSTLATGTSDATSINVGGSYVFVTDAGSNQIVQYSVGNSCALSTVVGGSVPNLGGTANPVNAVYVNGSSSNAYLYVINQSTTNSNDVNSSISAFTVTSTGQLQEVTDPKNNPYSVGSGPTCIVEDPSLKYVYTANNGDGTVTGKVINKANGQLSNLPRGTSFSAVGKATCLAVTGSID